MTAVCEHVPYDTDAALAVIPERRVGQVPVYCPCCGLGGYADDGDDLTADPMPCPYCGVEAVLDNRVAS